MNGSETQGLAQPETRMEVQRRGYLHQDTKTNYVNLCFDNTVADLKNMLKQAKTNKVSFINFLINVGKRPENENLSKHSALASRFKNRQERAEAAPHYETNERFVMTNGRVICGVKDSKPYLMITVGARIQYLEDQLKKLRNEHVTIVVATKEGDDDLELIAKYEEQPDNQLLMAEGQRRKQVADSAKAKKLATAERAPAQVEEIKDQE